MMHDPLDPRDAVRQPAPEARPAQQAEPVTSDREVTPPRTELPEAVHAYLDGEQVPEKELTAAERELELWKRINAEAGRRRRMATPAHIPQQILSKLADD
ncbi:MAG TPA: hypothetical protein VFV33_03990 [Gemmatimonadaceae bacterium]|nr:hypothetical protein [Gemmatimonadaceae bacterium]